MCDGFWGGGGQGGGVKVNGAKFWDELEDHVGLHQQVSKRPEALGLGLIGSIQGSKAAPNTDCGPGSGKSILRPPGQTDKCRARGDAGVKGGQREERKHHSSKKRVPGVGSGWTAEVVRQEVLTPSCPARQRRP